MKLTENSTTRHYLKCKLLADFDDSKLADYPLKFTILLKKRPVSVWDITFESFIKVVNYKDSVYNLIELLHMITNVNKNYLTWAKIKLTLPLFYHYKNEIEKICEMFASVSKEAPPSKVIVKDMQEFGLTSYVDYLADGRIIDHAVILQMPVHQIYAEYRRKVWKLINEIENMKVK